MRPFIPTAILISICLNLHAQPSDFISAKKRNNRTVKTYFPGSTLVCETVYGSYVEGGIIAIKNDSVFVNQYDVRAMPNAWGVATVDTLTAYVIGMHYKEIKRVIFRKQQSFQFIKNGTILIIGGIGYIALNVLNGKYLNESITGRENRKSLAIAAGVTGAGFLIQHLRKRGVKRYRIEYIRMNNQHRPF